jgi:hypothetical protein
MKVNVSKSYNSQYEMEKDVKVMFNNGWHVSSHQIHSSGVHIVNYKADIDEKIWMEQQDQIARETERAIKVNRIVYLSLIGTGIFLCLFLCLISHYAR